MNEEFSVEIKNEDAYSASITTWRSWIVEQGIIRPRRREERMSTVYIRRKKTIVVPTDGMLIVKSREIKVERGDKIVVYPNGNYFITKN